MFPTSIYENVYENFERIHLNVAGLVLYTTWGMVDLWFHQCATAITHVGPDSRKMAPRLQLGYKWCHGTLFKVLAPYGLVSIPHPLQTYKICLRSFICCGWADGSTNVPPLPTTCWSDSRKSNDVMVHWLRPQTHVEWFLYPLQTYKRCLRSFICYGLADGSTNVPLPPHFLILCPELRSLMNFPWSGLWRLRQQAKCFPHPYMRMYMKILSAFIWMWQA